MGWVFCVVRVAGVVIGVCLFVLVLWFGGIVGWFGCLFWFCLVLRFDLILFFGLYYNLLVVWVVWFGGFYVVLYCWFFVWLVNVLFGYIIGCVWVVRWVLVVWLWLMCCYVFVLCYFGLFCFVC